MTTNNNHEDKSRFIRWQGVLRDQLTFLNSLLMTFSVGISGYSFSLLQEHSFNPCCYNKIWFTSGLFTVFLSIIFGLLTALNRLRDFRKTLKKIKSPDSFCKKEDEALDYYGEITWCLFYWQIGTLALGILLLLLALSRIYSDKLF